MGRGIPPGARQELHLPEKRAQTNGHPPAKPEGLEGRVPLAKLIRDGIEPTAQILEGLLYEGKIHSMASEPGTGKTLLALWMAIQIMRAGDKVLYLDAENGPKLIAERLEELGANLSTLDDLFFYYPAETSLEAESLRQLAATVADVGPALAVFDSLADFLALSGLEENSNSDCTRWVAGVVQPLKDAGVASLILDHVPKGAKGPRGASSKLAKVDVQWNLEVTLGFDRERTGEIELKHTKDRECWLPKIARFSVGAGVFARSAGTIEEPEDDGLTRTAREILDRIRSAGDEGATWKALEEKTSKATLSRTLGALVKWGYVEKRGHRYRPVPPPVEPPPEPDGTRESGRRVEPRNGVDKAKKVGSTRFHNGSTEPHGSDESGGVPRVPHPFRGGTVEPDVLEPLGEDDYDRRVRERLDVDDFG